MNAAPCVTLYGIANCDTVKKSRAWLELHGRAVRFHDFKKSGVPAGPLDVWVQALGWERLLNRRGTTWRGLDAAVRDAIVDTASATRLMLAQPSLIKRPVVEWGGGAVTVGFDADGWAAR